jgi:hypothetical protein
MFVFTVYLSAKNVPKKIYAGEGKESVPKCHKKCVKAGSYEKETARNP